VGENDDLPMLAEFVQDLSESVDLGGVHGLHGVIDDDEAERAVGRGDSGQEQGKREGVLLALTHDAECRRLLAVDGDVHDKLADGGLLTALQRHGLEVDVALLAEPFPDSLRVVGEALHALFPQLGGERLDPGAGLPDVAQPGLAVLGGTSFFRPARQARDEPAPPLVPLFQLIDGVLLDHGAGIGQRLCSLIGALGKLAGVTDRPALDPGVPRICQGGRDPPGRPQFTARVLGGHRFLPQRGDLRGGARGPRRAQYLVRPAHRAGLLVGVAVAVIQSPGEEVGTLEGVLGTRRAHVLDVVKGLAQRAHCRTDLRHVGSLQVDRGTQLGEKTVVGRGQAGHQRLKGLEVRSPLGVNGHQRLDRAIVVLQRVQGLLELGNLRVRRPHRVVEPLLLPLEPVVRSAEVPEAEDRGDRVVHLGGLAADHAI
jgi:hypothetical protein